MINRTYTKDGLDQIRKAVEEAFEELKHMTGPKGNFLFLQFKTISLYNSSI